MLGISQAAGPAAAEGEGLLTWREVRSTGGLLSVYRAKVPGGWLVYVGNGYHHHGGVTFFPDPNHEWKGDSLP